MKSKKSNIIVAAFLHKDGKLFVAKRADNKKSFPGLFEMPGGHVEFGETPEEALAREIQEEIHVDIIIGDLFHTFTFPVKDDRKHMVELVYFATLKDPNQVIKLNDVDHSVHEWITTDRVDEILGNNKPEWQAAKKGFEILNKSI